MIDAGQLTAEPLAEAALGAVLPSVRESAAHWLRARLPPGKGFARFRLCDHAFADTELNALTTGVELWQMLGIGLTPAQHDEAVALLHGFQGTDGLCRDPSLVERRLHPDDHRPTEGDTFLTMTTVSALRALSTGPRVPIDYLASLDPETLVSRLWPLRGAHGRFAIGDVAVLVDANRRLGVAGSAEQQAAIAAALDRQQDPATGLWAANGGPVTPPYTPAVNRSFHVLRTCHNLIGARPRHLAAMIDSCLLAAQDVTAYGWGTGYACNDLDLALVLHTAARWSDHRRGEVAAWARGRIPVMLALGRRDGGFSFHHTHAMREHGGYAMSPGAAESDLWGTVMYLSTIALLVDLAHPGAVRCPWLPSEVHHPHRSGTQDRRRGAQLSAPAAAGALPDNRTRRADQPLVVAEHQGDAPERA